MNKGKFIENIYGHKKKLGFILEAIKNYSRYSFKPLPDIKILDFGCGNGTAISYKIAALGVQLIGIDFHSESIRFAKENNRFPNAKFILGNEDSALKTGECFDIIVYSDIIEHLPNPASTLKKIRAVHKKGGIIIGAIPNKYGPFELEKFISKWTGLNFVINKAISLVSEIKKTILGERKNLEVNRAPYNSESTHCQFFRLRDLYRLTDMTGYKLIQFSNGVFLGASVSGIFLRSRRFIKWNVNIADKLPPQLVSTWYFTCKKIY